MATYTLLDGDTDTDPRENKYRSLILDMAMLEVDCAGFSTQRPAWNLSHIISEPNRRLRRVPAFTLAYNIEYRTLSSQALLSLTTHCIFVNNLDSSGRYMSRYTFQYKTADKFVPVEWRQCLIRSVMTWAYIWSFNR
ncbi:hypothetical protein QCA50_013044 [Cerrena zonata]|uniref:Uncharacterized protein n=1 Tax=Cerrena zonata TaxID=2478898 RepID=A0AAW0FRI6_9APHY